MCSVYEHLQRRLSEPESAQESSFLLNLADGERVGHMGSPAFSPRCVFSPLSNRRQAHVSQFQNEILKLTNDLSIAIRELPRRTVS